MHYYAVDVAVIGGGPGGLAAAVASAKLGASALVVERAEELGGVLLQCIHPGFGLKLYNEELTGPEYAWRWIGQLGAVNYLTGTMVLSIEPGFEIIASNARWGMVKVQAKAVVLAMGCRERPRGALAIPGTRPTGVMTAGTAQRLVNIHGYMPGKRVAILGSGDIGMIMARRLTYEGADVLGVYELMPYLTGLRRNYVQCLQDYDIPLNLSHTISDIRGRQRLVSVQVARVNEQLKATSECRDLAVDTLLLSVGLIPENELTRTFGVAMDSNTGGPMVDNRMQTSQPGLFAAGNVVHVHDLADDVSLAGTIAGENAAHYALGQEQDRGERIRILPGANLRSIVPQWLNLADIRQTPSELQFRVRQPIESVCRTEFNIDGQTLRGKRFPYVRPGEMVSAPLPNAIIAELIPGQELTVDVMAV